MPEVPATGQLALLIAATILIAGAAILSFVRIRLASDSLRVAGKALFYCGIVLGLGVLVWHSVRRGSWLPLQDNFDALIWLGLLLGLFMAYVQRVRPMRGLDWFILPVVVLLLV